MYPLINYEIDPLYGPEKLDNRRPKNVQNIQQSYKLHYKKVELKETKQILAEMKIQKASSREIHFHFYHFLLQFWHNLGNVKGVGRN